LHLNWRMPLGGALRGVLPNPTLALGVVFTDAENIIAARVFGPRSAGTTATSSSGSGALELIQDQTLTVAGTSVTFSGLDGDTDEVYFLTFRAIKAVVATIAVTLRPNGITTNQVTRATVAGSGTGTISTSTLQIVANGGPTTGDTDHGTVTLDAKTGALRTGRLNSLEAAGSAVFIIDGAISWNETATNITSLDVVCDQANGLAAGSYFRLYRLNS
jgi:hypothetical protein